MASDEKSDIFEDTVSKTSDPEIGSETTKVRNVPASEEEESVSAKAKEAGRSLKDLVYSLGRKTKEITEEMARELKEKSVDIGATTDARDIQRLGGNVDKLITVFEDTMPEIRKEHHDNQERLLVGYRKLLEEQISVINARTEMARRLKPGA
ncbi:MAG TPA: hypothetical protein VGQ03_10470 [Nitrososphaera sp.]|jgi:hypothetical protein|nr:hypothetical protein [Nitrososphaera sp.]